MVKICAFFSCKSRRCQKPEKTQEIDNLATCWLSVVWFESKSNSGFQNLKNTETDDRRTYKIVYIFAYNLLVEPFFVPWFSLVKAIIKIVNTISLQEMYYPHLLIILKLLFLSDTIFILFSTLILSTIISSFFTLNFNTNFVGKEVL